MVQMAISLGKIYGIPILLDYTWFVIFGLIAWTVGFSLMPAQYPGLSTTSYLLIGVLASVLLFVSILLHELAHSVVAKRNHLKIASITLFLFGGVSAMEEEPNNPRLELKMSGAGPLTSLVLSGLVEATYLVSASLRLSALIQAPLQYIAYFNFIIALFNLIPAFPMDGGRILRSVIWMRSKDIFRSTKIASRIGQVIAYVLMFIGVFLIFTVDLLDGIWLVLVGWFVSSGSKASVGQQIMQRDLKRLSARDVMTRNVQAVSADMGLSELSQEIFAKKHNGFAVTSGNDLLGCVTSHDLRKSKRDQWGQLKVSDIMTTKANLVAIKEMDAASDAISLMNSKRIGRVFVLDETGQLSGIITRTDIVRAVQMQEESMHSQNIGMANSGLSRTFVAEKGMYFVIEQEMTGELLAHFDSNRLRLADQRDIETNGKKVKQFVFEVLVTGTHSVILEPITNEQARSAPSKT